MTTNKAVLIVDVQVAMFSFEGAALFQAEEVMNNIVKLLEESTLVQDAHSTFDSKALAAEEIIKHHNNVLGGWFVQLKSAHETVKTIDYLEISSKRVKESWGTLVVVERLPFLNLSLEDWV